MAEYQRYTTRTGAVVLVETEAPGGEIDIDRGMEAVAALAEAISGQIERLPEASRPEEIELAFGLSPGPDAVLAVTSGEAPLRLVLRWSGDLAEGVDEFVP